MSDLRQREARERDKPYLGFIAGLPCISCMVRHGTIKRGVQVAHCRASYPEEGWRAVGMQEKPHDARCTPLCVDCHLNGKHAQHRTNETQWWADLGIYPPDLCAALMDAFKAGRPGAAVLASFAAGARKAKGAAGSEPRRPS